MSEEIFAPTGKRIRALRGDLTQPGFAKRLGVSSKSIEGWEAGKRLPDGSSLLRLHEAFGADISFILTGKTGGVARQLPPDEEALLALYRQANSDGRERIRQISATAAVAPKRAKVITQAGANSHQYVGDHGIQIGGAAGAVNINRKGKK